MCSPVVSQRTPQPPYSLWLSAKSVLTASPPPVSVSQAGHSGSLGGSPPTPAVAPSGEPEGSSTLHWNPQIFTWFSGLRWDGEGTAPPPFSPLPRPGCPVGMPTARAAERKEQGPGDLGSISCFAINLLHDFSPLWMSVSLI